jgi:hypothetical protein
LRQAIFSQNEEYELAMQGDGNLVVYKGGNALWASGTSGRTPSSGPTRYPRPAFTACPPPPPPPNHAAQRPRFSMNWTWNRGVTRLHQVKLPHLPRGATVTVDCRHKRCGLNHRLRAGRRHLRRLISGLDGHAFRAGSRLLITIAERGHRSERIEVRIRYGALPRVRLLGRRHH